MTDDFTLEDLLNESVPRSRKLRGLSLSDIPEESQNEILDYLLIS